MKAAIIRRKFRLDGGAEKAAQMFLDAFCSVYGNVEILCESWRGDRSNCYSVSTISSTGFFRLGKLKSFTRKAEMLVARDSCSWVHSHEWVCGSDSLRLGDGLHSEWAKCLVESKGRFARTISKFDPFHTYKINQERKCMTASDLRHVVVNSKFIGDQVLDKYPHLSDRLKLIYNSVDSGFYDGEAHASTIRKNRKGQNRRLLFVGSGWHRKGLAKGLEILRRLPDCYTLSVVGSDKASKEYLTMARNMGIAKRVEFCGALPMNSASYKQFDLLISPSMYEPFPNAATESLLSGVPVLSSSSSGVSDFRGSRGIHIFEHIDEATDIVKAMDLGIGVDLDFFQVVFSKENIYSFAAETRQ